MAEVKKTGRPKKQWDMALAEKLAKIHCTQEEIASIVGVSTDTLRRSKEFCEMYKKARDEGRASLRRVQMAKAMEGNSTMLVWLGKQYLGQSDKVDSGDDKLLAALDGALAVIGERARNEDRA